MSTNLASPTKQPTPTIKGTATWNPFYASETTIKPAGFNLDYTFVLHLRVEITSEPNYPLDACRKILDGRTVPGAGETQSSLVHDMLATIAGNDLLDVGDYERADLKAIAAAVQAGTLSSSWTFRAYHDFNSDPSQSGSYLEIEYKLPFGDSTKVLQVEDVLRTGVTANYQTFADAIDAMAKGIIDGTYHQS